MTATAKSGALATVFLAASAALVCATAIGVLVGGALFRWVPEFAIRAASGVAFLTVGVWILIKG
jgi:putative Ca2+/H+ antiporter (TMEM165/GDT1 family)